jgi:hypothetical protein
MIQVVNKQAKPQVIQTQEERSLAEWQQCYPDLWLLLEVTREEEREPLAGRLIAVAPDDMALVDLWQEYKRQGKITAMLHGRYTDAGPTVVASYA